MVTATRPEGTKNLEGLKVGQLLDIEGLKGLPRVIRSDPNKIVVVTRGEKCSRVVQSYSPSNLRGGELTELGDPENIGPDDPQYMALDLFINGKYDKMGGRVEMELRSRW